MSGSWRGQVRRGLDRVEARVPSRVGAGLDTVGRSGRRSYSFYGEDAVILGLLDRARFESGGRFPVRPTDLTYVDVGAWRPVDGSNTFALYRRGMRGTLVEPNPHLARLLARVRPRDTVLPVACAEGATAELVAFGRHAESNTTTPEFAAHIERTQGVTPIARITVRAQSLPVILAGHLDRHGSVFLLSVDIEGADAAALASVDWSVTPRPAFVIAEVGGATPLTDDSDPVTTLLKASGYAVLAQCSVSRIFVDRESPWNGRLDRLG